MSMTDVGDETGVRSRIKFMLIAESCKLWMTDSAAANIAQLDCSAGLASCGCVHSVAPLSSRRYTAFS